MSAYFQAEHQNGKTFDRAVQWDSSDSPESMIRELAVSAKAGVIQRCGTNLINDICALSDDAVEEGILVSYDEIEELEWVTRDEDEDGDEDESQPRSSPNVTFEDTGTHDFWQILRITNSAGVTAYVARIVEADALSGVVSHFLGVFPTAEAAREGIQARGYLNEDDLRARCPAG